MNLIPFIQCGPDWNKPSDEELSAASADADKAYTLDQLREAFAAVAGDALLCAAGHLGFGSGFIPIDLSRLPADRPDLDNAIIIYRRGKTGISRMCPLMPQAAETLRNYLAYRAKFKNMRASSTGNFFVTIYGNTLSQHRGERSAGRL
jgi:site-specific recombinase XerC